MSIILKQYQGEAVNFLVGRLNSELNDGTKRTVVFKSPTGSGKTVMAGTIIKELSETNENIAFVWASVADGKLNTQSAEKIRAFYPEVPVSLLDNVHLGMGMINKTVYAVSWQKLWSDTNNMMKEGEGFNFNDFIIKTKENNIKIVLIVDESHIGLSKDTNIQKVKDLIDADVTLNMSATPKSEVDYEVDFDDVIKEGVIKKDIYVNKGISNYIDRDELTRVLYTAMDKRDELERLYPNNINPLCVIQLPNSKGGENEKLDSVQHILSLRGKTLDNDKVAVWLNGNKSECVDNDSIKDMDSPVEYLLFKSAIATGWDCTRAHILVKLKDTKSNSFEIQTVGRILRMPERKHYANEALNSAYIYSDLDAFEFSTDAFKEKDIKSEEVNLIEEFEEEVQFPAYYRNRVQLSRISGPLFGSIMYKILDKHKENIKFNTENVQSAILNELNFTLNGIGENQTGLKTVNTISSPSLVDSILRKQIKAISSVPNNQEAVNHVMISIVKWISDVKGWDRIDGVYGIQKSILNQIDEYKVFIYEAIEIYDIEREEQKVNNPAIEYIYSPKSEIWHSPNAKELIFNKYAYDRCLSKMNELELRYAKSIDSDDNVLFWYKNGDSGQDNFSIAYEGGNFFPDFIIKHKNGKLKIGETKGKPFHIEAKREALTAYGIKHGILTEYILE